MTDRFSPPVGPRGTVTGAVMQFTLLIVPVVMNGFFMVYALTGWILEGRDKSNWALEAESVAFRVGSGIVAFSLLVVLYTRLRGGGRWHVLVISGLGHAVVALMLILSVVITVRL